MDIILKLAEEFSIGKEFIKETVSLIDEGNTSPFIARYRKEATGGMSDVTLRELDERLKYLQALEERKAEVIILIEDQGKMTDKLRDEILSANILQRVEDLYKPFKHKKTTRASKAKERGLEPLALYIFEQSPNDGDTLENISAPYINPEKEIETWDAALSGALDIIAEIIADDPDIISDVRDFTFNNALIKTEASDNEEKTVYEMYYDFSEPVSNIANHRVLAINRGEKEKKLKVKIEIEAELITSIISKKVLKDIENIFTSPISDTIVDSYKRLIAPSIEREIRNTLTERAEKEAVKVFAENTYNLLMTPPVQGKRILAVDPGYRTGCKVAALDETGKLLAYTTIYPTVPKQDIKGSEEKIDTLIKKYALDIIVIGNGTASRETEKFIADYIGKSNTTLSYTIVNEAGASVYSASKLATEEYPDLDVTTRGAMSIGRRLQDPLAELVKIEPKHIGVGQYQHDINQNLLNGALSDVVENCVNRVGVDLNTASPSLLSYISGINSGIAKNIVKYRESNGSFSDRKELLKVPKLGEKTYKQCAGFMRITGGKNPLDGTGVHPESYNATEVMLNKLNIDKNEILNGGIADIENKIIELYPSQNDKKADKKSEKRLTGLASLSVLLPKEDFESKKRQELERQKRLKSGVKKLANDLEIGELTLSDIISEMKKPARDPREGMPEVIFRNDVLSFDDLKIGMELSGTVRNVVDFGAFVDIGVKNDGLVHISRMSKRYVKHPSDVVKVGDRVEVTIVELDKDSGKVGLSMTEEK